MKENSNLIKNIIFDWSGVISDSIKIHYFIVNNIFEKFGAKKISFEELRREWEQPYMHFYNKYLPKLTREEEKIAYETFLSKYPIPKLYPGVVDLLRKFKKKGVNMIVMSSDPAEKIFFNIMKYNLKGIFKEIYFEIYDKTKVTSEIIKQNQFNPRETIFIGDTIHDIEAGKSAKIKTAGVTWGLHSKEKLCLANPDFIVHDLKELESVIFKKSKKH